MSTSVLGFPVQAQSTPRQVLGDELMLHISQLLTADKAGGGGEDKGERLGRENHRANCGKYFL